jgi:hypothetical protein
MTPPLPGTAQSAARRRRSPADLFFGLLAVAVLTALTIGVPYALIRVFGLPVPHTMPRLSTLTHQLDMTTILKVLSVLVWLAWLQLVWCVIAEVRAAVRYGASPAQVPLASGTQAVVHRLVAAALLLSAATTALSPALAHQVSGPAPVSAGREPGLAAGSQAASQNVLPPRLASPPRLAPPPGAAHPPVPPRTPGPVHTPGPVRSPGPVHTPGPVRSPEPAHSPEPQPSPGPADTARPPSSAQPPASDQSPQVTHLPRVDKIYVVHPPRGRFHESLWEIAQRFLGDGQRYREIFALNAGRIQPDGSRLTIASLIRPGWVLHMPRDAHGPGIAMVSPSARHRAGHDRPAPASAIQDGAGQDGAGQDGATQDSATQDGAGQDSVTQGRADQGRADQGRADQGRADQGRADQGRADQGHAPGLDALLDSAPGQHAHQAWASEPRAGDNRPAARRGSGSRYPNELAAASLLAAGVLAALGRRRREQLWQRAFGRRLIMPEGEEAALAESAIRSGADEPSVQLLDSGLRYLSYALAVAGRTPPTVFAAHLSPENLDLWIAPADLDPPAPWTAVGDGQVWRLPFAALTLVDLDESSDALALLPGLVSIGTDQAGRVLVDLEAAHGLIALRGPHQLVTAVLSSMAMELATSRWSDQMHLTLVGFGEDLVDLAPGRVTAVRTLDEALPALEARAAAVIEAMASTGVDSAAAGRSLGINPDAWAPHYLITAVPPTTAQRSRLLALAKVRHAAAVGYVVAGEVPGASWTWEVTAEGRLVAGVLGLDVEAQLLPGWQHDAVLQLFDAAAQNEGVAWPAPPADSAPSQQLDPGNVMPVEITILGPVSVQAPGTVQPEWAGLLTELVVYLAAQSGAVHLDDLTASIWPRGVPPEIRDEALDRARDWLGTDTVGRAQLAVDAGGRLHLGSGVRVDWQVFRALVGRAALAPPGSAEEAGYLVRALELVQGQLLDGRDPRHYAWVVADGLEYEVHGRVADAAHRLAALRLMDGNAWGAMDAARAGLRLAFSDELLWRDLLRSVHATGQDDLVRAVVDELSARVALNEVLPRMAPETEALIDEICPSWRSAVS